MPNLSAKVTADVSQFSGAMARMGAAAGSAATIAIGAIGAISAVVLELGRNALTAAADMETLTVRMKQFTGSLAAAKREMKELIEFSARTPFEPDEVVRASITLRALTDDALGSAESLKMLGDSAAKGGVSLDQAAKWVGRLYGLLERGRPIAEVSNEMAKYKIISGEVADELQRMVKGGASISETWPMVVASMKTAEGAMEDLSKTAKGLWSTIMGLKTLLLNALGKDALEYLKDIFEKIIVSMDELMKSPEVEELAASFGMLVKELSKIKFDIDDIRAWITFLRVAVGMLTEIVKLFNMINKFVPQHPTTTAVMKMNEMKRTKRWPVVQEGLKQGLTGGPIGSKLRGEAEKAMVYLAKQYGFQSSAPVGE